MARVVASTGWTWDYVENTLTVPRLLALNKEWRRRPPTHVLVAAFMGFKPPPDPIENGQDPLNELMTLFPQGRIG